MDEPRRNLTAGERADWVTRNPEEFYKYVRDESIRLAYDDMEARAAKRWAEYKYNRWYRRIWRRIKR